MMKLLPIVLIILSTTFTATIGHAADTFPLGTSGTRAEYRIDREGSHPASVVERFSLTCGPIEEREEARYQWLYLDATKAGGESFGLSLLCERYPEPAFDAASQTIARYLFQDNNREPIEYQNGRKGEAVLPSLGAWEYLLPQSPEQESEGEIFPESLQYLGHTYRREGPASEGEVKNPPAAKTVNLLPDLWIGVPHNSRQKDGTRRWDDSDYELVRLTQEDYGEMIEAGMTCFRVDAEQAEWIQDRDVFYWGLGGAEIDFPKALYRSNYLGPALYFDEPMVGTRDHVVRPQLKESEDLRKEITPQWAFERFKEYFHKKKYEGAPTSLIKGLRSRTDIDLGDIDFLQQNQYTWETMISSAAYQLSEGEPGPPDAIVFEPPGMVGTIRTLPEMNMAYGCQILADNPSNLTSILYGFTRGAARLTDKNWGTSIYGSVNRSDATWLFTRAYDMGATRFMFWDSHRLACVPYDECLALSRHLRNHAASRPDRDLSRLRQAAEVAILLPPGYNLGHVHMGRGNLWGLGELNLERLNSKGQKYRDVMKNFFTEIERCLRLGIAFDLLWDLPGIQLSDYREVVQVREDGKVEVRDAEGARLLDDARIPPRSSGAPPRLAVEGSADARGNRITVSARATVVEGAAPVYYTLGSFPDGVYRNAMVCWELYGPEEEDYRFLLARDRPPLVKRGENESTVEIEFEIDRSGTYTLRAATADLQGRTAVFYQTLTVVGDGQRLRIK